MDPTIVAAAITGVCTIAAAVITVLVTKWYERRSLNPMSNDRRSAIVGSWRGTIEQGPITGTLDVQLKTRGKEVVGAAQIKVTLKEKERNISLDLKGGFLRDQFLKLDYKNSNDDTIQFGSILLALAPDPVELKGRYAGYGSITEKIVSGNVVLTKFR